MRRATKVQVERVVGLAEVVQLKDELLGEVLGAAPDDPAHADDRRAVLVSRGIDAAVSGTCLLTSARAGS